MSQLEEKCIKLIRFSSTNFEETLNTFDTKQLDSIIQDFQKMETNLLTTSNNLNKSLLQIDQTNQKLKQFLQHK